MSWQVCRNDGRALQVTRWRSPTGEPKDNDSANTREARKGQRQKNRYNEERGEHVAAVCTVVVVVDKGTKQHEGWRGGEKPWSEEEEESSAGGWRLLLSRAGRAPGHQREGARRGLLVFRHECPWRLTRAAVRSLGWPASGTSRPRWGCPNPGAGPCPREKRRRCAAGAAASRRPEGQAAMPAVGGAATTGKEAPGTRRRSGADAPATAASAEVVLAPASVAPSRRVVADRAPSREGRARRLRRARDASRG